MEAPNILFVSIDCLRADAISPANTPFINALQAEGLRFDRHFTTGAWTAPSFIGMMTGEQPRSYSHDMAVHSYPETLAEALREEGYRTIATLDANYWISSSQGFDRGFDEFTNFVDADRFRFDKRRERDEDSNPLDTQFPSLITERFPRAVDAAWNFISGNEKLLSSIRKIDMMAGSPKTSAGAPSVIRSFIDEFAKSKGQEPKFGWVHFMDLHHPYLPNRESLHERFAYPSPVVSYVNNAAVHPDESLGGRGVRFLESLYERKVSEIDRDVQRLVQTVKSKSERDTIVLIVGDHGEEFGEHGRLTHSNKPYNELIHVPLVIDGTETGTVSRNTSSIDLKTAITEIARGETGIVSTFETTEPVCRYIHHCERVAERTNQALNGRTSPSQIRALVRGDLKIHYDSDVDTVEVYDLEADFVEQVDLSKNEEHRELARLAIREYVREEQELADQELLNDVDF